MSIKINKIRIINFKSFDDVEIEFNGARFIVFDGPNGYGKTTIYDAIELLFTGKIQRYCRLYSEVVDGRNVFNEHPYLCESSSTGDLMILCELNINDEKIYLKRCIKRIDLESEYNVVNTPSQLYKLDDFNSDKCIAIKNHEDFFKELLGKNYLTNFEFINYVEQEENLIYLKQKDSDRKNAIGHLFNIGHIKTNLEKVEILYSKVGKLVAKKVKDNIENRKKEIDKLEKSLGKESDGISFKKLINWNDYFWDREIIDFNKYNVNDLLGENSEFNKLMKFIEEFEDFRKLKKNQKIDELLEEKTYIDKLLLYSHHLSNYELLKENNNISKEIIAYIENSNGDIVEFLNSKNSTLNNSHSKVLNDNDFVRKYTEKVISLRKSISDLSILDKSLISMKNARDNLIQKKKDCNAFPENSSVCVLCGHDWSETNILLQSISDQTKALEAFIKISSNSLNNDLQTFKNEFILKINIIFNEYLAENNFDQQFFNSFQKFYLSKEKDKLPKIESDLKKLDIEYEDLLNKVFNNPEHNLLHTLIKRLDSGRVKVTSREMSLSNDEIFSKIFKNDFELAKSISKSDLKNKEKYIHMVINVYNSNLLKEKKDEYSNELNKYKEAKVLYDKLKKIKKIYNDSIKDYQTNIINDIEVLFHLYSGRIVQDRKGGNGLFIMSNNGIRFVDKPNSTYDALFKLSSGQLAALVISFTLALNKKYSQDKLLLIDDPVQTLDDLNVAGLIELLRNEFYDRQILIATHEDMMSAYMRYKFEKYSIQTSRINLNQLQLNPKVK